jgi:hypothetical protein
VGAGAAIGFGAGAGWAATLAATKVDTIILGTPCRR